MHNIPDAPPLEGATHLHSGKVRDLYRLDDGHLLMVASDRISAYDFVLDSTIPDKGEILTRMSLWWFDQLADMVPNHVVSTDVPAAVRGRAVVCEELAMYPVECVARGYLTGSGLLDYQSTGEVCGIPLPRGLVEGSRLPEPIFTPATKAALGDHDENVSYEAVVGDIGADAAAQLRDLTLNVYARADGLARDRGIILADTKFEFGTRRDGGPTRARSSSATRCSRRTRAATGRRTTGNPAAPRSPTTSRSCATGSPHPRAAGTERQATVHHPCLTRSWNARGRATSRRSSCSPTRSSEESCLMRSATLRYAVPVHAAFTYLADPRNRPEWQASLRRVELVDDGEPRAGFRWRDQTAARIDPEMVITEFETDVLWAETGRWRRIEADLTLRFAPHRGGCSVDVEFAVRGKGFLRPVGWAASGAGLLAVRSDLRRAGRILEARAAV